MLDLNFLLPLASATSQDALWALSLAVGAGCLLTVLARKLHLPTIVLLLLGGFALGSEGLALINPDALGDLLPVIVSLAVGIILFEGGLTLDIKDFKHTSTVIKRLLTVGVLITWFGAALTVYLVFKTTPAFALLMGSLIIVTGPTVIMPLLRRIRVQQRVGSILHWEAVLIDSIGVFIAILCYEWVVEGGSSVALPNFLLRIVSGAGLGFCGGYLIYWFMKRGWVPDSMVNGFALASAMLLFGATELIKPEAGLLSVTIAGLIIGIKKPRQLREVKAFKAEIVELLIGLLFLLLVARLELQQFISFFQQGGGWVLLSVILLIRPISIAVSSWGTPINLREKALLSWVAPRGVVAASMASLFAISLNNKENPVGDPALMESFVYSVICATVLIQGLSAGIVARVLGVQRPPPNDWLILGAHHFGRQLARKLMREDVQRVILLDTNARNVALARKENLLAMHCDAMEAEKLYENEEALFGAGYVLALTDNVELNELLMQRWAAVLDSEKVFGWIPSDSPSTEEQITGQSVFSDLSRPAVIGSELMQGESNFEVVVWEDGKTLPSGDWHPLFIRRGKQLRAVPQDAALKELVKNEDEVICLRRSEGFLLRALQNGGLIHIDCASLEDFYAELARSANSKIAELSKDQILKDLDTQGRVFPAFIGHGIAIPHVYCAELQCRVCIVARLSPGLKIPGQEEAIDFAFFLISPTGDTEGHLATLAEIAKTCRTERLRVQIKAAEKIEDIITAVSC
ncbi:MAG: NhaP-type Na+/H+ or K+/H+ antiporter/mannitol [Lentimonas sp.]|jgi:NhaP-type Na+/H+ or K+/H+ antiporter/mannitol/fructose-specific phosphotransferase system IIA component (Ntr-type)